MCKEGFVNCDDMYARKLMEKATCPITTYGIDNKELLKIYKENGGYYEQGTNKRNTR